MKLRTIIISLILAIIVIYLLYRKYKSDIRIDYVRHIALVLDEVERYLVIESFKSDPPTLPQKIPNSITGNILYGEGAVKHSTEIVLADPFKKVGENLDYLQAIGGNRDITFSYGGYKLSYTRLTDELAIIYSNGPDLDDDISNEQKSVLVDWVEGFKLTDSIANSTYDPTNGLESNGDLANPINIRKSQWIRRLNIQR